MAYDPRPLASGDTLVASRDAIRTNFTTLETVLNANHVDIDASGEGKHKFMQMPEQSSAPTTASNEGGLYTKEADSVTNLFFRQENSGGGGGTEIQLTAAQAPTVATNGSTFLPGGLLMQWGKVTTPGISGQVTFPEAYSAAPYSINITAQGSAVGVGSTAIPRVSSTIPTTTTFNYTGFGTLAPDFLYWMAIGPA